MSQPLDLLIPQGQCIVVLDTSPARNLAHENICPLWVNAFEEMAGDGYSFSLADGAFAELLSQMANGAIPNDRIHLMLERLTRFLNSRLPIFPGKCDVLAAIGARMVDQNWSQEVSELSLKAWGCLNNTVGKSLGECRSANGELQDERNSWFAIFDKMRAECNYGSDELDQHMEVVLSAACRSIDDKYTALSPPMSVRCDLQMKLLWRQFVSSQRLTNPYNPQSSRKVNDGIDFDLYNYFLLPALVVADDNGFFGSLASINSFQTRWFWKPCDLAAAWQRDEYPQASWPST